MQPLSAAARRLLLACLVVAARQVLGAAHDADAGAKAHMLVHQELVTPTVAVGENCTFRWRMINSGEATAYDIAVWAPSWPSDQLELVKGQPRVKISELAPGDIATHEFTVNPQAAGLLAPEGIRPHVSYTSGGDDAALKGTAADLGVPVKIATRWQRRQQTASYLREWTRLALSAAVAVGVPALVWATLRMRLKKEFP